MSILKIYTRHVIRRYVCRVNMKIEMVRFFYLRLCNGVAKKS